MCVVYPNYTMPLYICTGLRIYSLRMHTYRLHNLANGRNSADRQGLAVLAE